MIAIFAFALLIAPISASYSFLSVGDWGGAALDEQDKTNVYTVSKQMATTAADLNAQFIIGTGDNFYWCGIQNTSDYQINVDFVQPYADSALQVPWYQSLGNHEYGYNVSAQIDYMSMNPLWILPSRYYMQRKLLSGSTYMTLIVLDTSPCVSDYRGTNQKYWDPCSTEYPTCSLVSTDDDFEGPCQFHENILTQSCDTQYSWFENALASVPSDDWLIVVGHHPIDECDERDLTSLLQSHGFSIYLNGHAHTLTQYNIDGSGAYVTTGAGSLVNTPDQSHPVTMHKKAGKDIARGMFKSSSTHSYKTIYNNVVAGFTSHTFSDDFSTLTTNYIQYDGTVIHSFVINKSGAIISSQK